MLCGFGWDLGRWNVEPKCKIARVGVRLKLGLRFCRAGARGPGLSGSIREMPVKVVTQ